jgi:hypothetical protein
VPSGRLCNRRPCWRPAGVGFTFKDASGRNRGVVQIGLKPGTAGKGRVGLTAKGASLPLPALPLTASAGTTVQLRRDDDTAHCWQAVFPASRRNSATTFAARLP